MRPRSLDAAERRACLREIRTRVLTVRVRAGRVKLRWWLPAWALEEPPRFVLRTTPPLARFLPAPPRAARTLAARNGAVGATPAPGGDASRAPTPGPPGTRPSAGRAGRPPGWEDVDGPLSEWHRDPLPLPDGAPLPDVAAGETRIVIEEIRL